jgi:hypothetical protein
MRKIHGYDGELSTTPHSRMEKRHFLGAAVVAGAAPAFASRGTGTAPVPTAGPTLLTITGAITRSNRGALDPALDQMMARQKLAFDRAYALDFAALAALPARTIRPTLEYDGKPHTLRGPLLLEVLAQAGAQPRDAAKVLMRAVDGYATHLDGKPMPLGGLGPLWAVYDADRVPEMAALPVAQRFGACPWALYHLEVMA